MTNSFDPLATHLITGSVARTEKVVLSAASGLWLLHPSFVTDSLSQGRWQKERKFEWGAYPWDDTSPNFLRKEREEASKEGKKNTAVQLADAARNWRDRSSCDSKFGGKAFSNMKAILVMPDERKVEFEKLISAGGGQVVQAKAAGRLLHHHDDVTNAPEVTHVFTESAYIRKENVDYYGLAVRRIPVLNPLFLYDFLISPYEFRQTLTTTTLNTDHMLEEAKPQWQAHLIVAEQFLDSCFNGSSEGVRSALQSGVDLNTRDTSESERVRSSGIHEGYAIGKTGLKWAVMRKHNTVVELLLGTPGIDINAEDGYNSLCPGLTALHMAIPQDLTNNNNNPEGLALLVACKDLDLNKPDHYSPLLCAVVNDAVECVQLLVSDPRVDPNIGPIWGCDNERTQTPLMYAVKTSNEAAVLVPLLLANPRVSLNMIDHNDFGSTPLMRAVKENQREVVEMLLADARIDLSTRDTYERRDEDLAR